MICTTPVTRYFTADGKVHYRHSENNVDCPSVLPDPVSLREYGPSADGTTIFDIPLRLRVTANPGGLSHEFFKERFIDPITREDDVVFIPAALKDNPSLNQSEYAETLSKLSPVDRERLLNGDWEVMDAGNMFDRGAFEYTDSPPEPYEVKAKVRFWDLAATDSKKSDYTAGALVSVTHDGRWFIEDMIHVQKDAPEVEKIMRETAIKDGIGVPIWCEQEPGSSGKAYVSHLKRNVLVGFMFNGERSTGKKEDRAKPLASQAEAKNVFLVKADWNKAFIDEASLFPKSKNDDQIDAAAGGLNKIALSGRRPLRLIV
jgi:predicted phage terminase large subunit-like protein